LTIDKVGKLQETFIQFEVLHEVTSGEKDERIALGNIKLNLAEYVWASEQEGEEAVCMRYLMQDSKINSTLKVSSHHALNILNTQLTVNTRLVST
jgi:hypothetical protein